jgi:hypothetical protein
MPRQRIFSRKRAVENFPEIEGEVGNARYPVSLRETVQAQGETPHA